MQDFVSVTVHVTPGSKKDQVTRIGEDGMIWLKISAPPLEGKANRAVCLFLAEILGIQKNRVELVHGEKSRIKTIRIHGIDPEIFRERLQHLVI